MKRYLLTHSIVLSAILFFCGLWFFVAYGYGENAAVPDRLPDYADFVDNHTFPYAAPPGKIAELKNNYAKLRTGLTFDQTIKIMGTPDYAESISSKAEEPGFMGTAWTYLIEKADPHLTNIKTDITIQIFFDRDGKAHWIVSNLAGLEPVGTPQMPADRPTD